MSEFRGGLSHVRRWAIEGFELGLSLELRRLD